MRRFPLIVTLMLLIVLAISPASSTTAETKGGSFIASPEIFKYRMTPEECLWLYTESGNSHELCPGDMVEGTEVSKAYVRSQMATFMNAALGNSWVVISYEFGPTPSGADNYLNHVTEKLY